MTVNTRVDLIAGAEVEEDTDPGFFQYKATTVHSTHPDPTAAPNMFPSLEIKTRNRRWSYAIYGILVAQGIIKANRNDPHYIEEHDLAIDMIAETLNLLEFKS